MLTEGGEKESSFSRQPHDRYGLINHIFEVICEDSGSRSKTFVWFFRPNPRQLQRLSWQASRGKLPSPQETWCMASVWLSPKGVALKVSGPLASHTLHMLPFLDQMPLLLGLFIWGFGNRSFSRDFAEDYLLGAGIGREKGENLKTLSLTLSAQCFPLSACPSSWPQGP